MLAVLTPLLCITPLTPDFALQLGGTKMWEGEEKRGVELAQIKGRWLHPGNTLSLTYF